MATGSSARRASGVAAPYTRTLATAKARADARWRARTSMPSNYPGANFIVVNAAGCGAMMKEYGHLLADDPLWSARAAAVSTRVRDVTELLAEAGPDGRRTAAAGPNRL